MHAVTSDRLQDAVGIRDTVQHMLPATRQWRGTETERLLQYRADDPSLRFEPNMPYRDGRTATALFFETVISFW